MIRSGQLEQSLYAARASMERLLGYENVRMYYFQNEEDVILDLDLYMDPIHFSADVNHWIVLEAQKEDSAYLVTPDNREELLGHMEELAETTIPQRAEEQFMEGGS